MKLIHMEGTWRLESTSAGLHPCEARNSVKDVQTLPGADNDSDHNLLVAKLKKRLKKIIRFQKSTPRWDLQKTKSAGYPTRETLCN